MEKNTTNAIYNSLFAVQSRVKKLLKEGINNYQGYRYFTEYSVLETLRPLLEEFGLLILISDLGDFEYSKPEKDFIVKYQKKCEVISCEDGSKLEFTFWAVGSNSDLSKAKGSAETYAVKYFLSKFFLIPSTDNLDPDSR